MPRLSTDLLAQARMLANREPRSPRQASLRRSVSTSYYALFHFLIEETTKLIVGSARRHADLRQFAGRAFVHGKMKAVCSEFVSSQPSNRLLRPFWASLQVQANADLRTVARNFAELQQARHEADYDLSIPFTRQRAQTTADQAEDAMTAWDNLKTHNEPLARLFATSMMLWPGLSGR